jgi:hypothetical protein
MAATSDTQRASFSSRPLLAQVQETASTTRPVRLLDRYFYLFMSLLIAAVVLYVFSRTVDEKLIHPAIPRPHVLYLHAAIFSAWVVFLILQSGLARTGNLDLHRRMGWFGAVLGAAMFVIGVWTAITMAHFNIIHLHARFADLALLVSFYDMVAFGIPLALAIYWRKRPEFHRRLILIATCALTAAAFGRFPVPPHVRPGVFFYACVDLLILLGIVRDLIVARRIHPVYLCALPSFAICQVMVVHAIYHHSSTWLRIAHLILG